MVCNGTFNTISPPLQQISKEGTQNLLLHPQKNTIQVRAIQPLPTSHHLFNVPHVEGLPHGAETTSDVSFSLGPLIMTAMDRTERDIELLLIELKPQIVFFDFTYWLPNMTRRLGIKSFHYLIVSPATVSYCASPPRMNHSGSLTEIDLMKPPLGYPISSIKLHAHEAKFLASKRNWEFGSGVLFYDRLYSGLTQSDAIGFKGCSEIEGPFVDYLEEQFGKPVLLSGPIIPERPNAVLEEKWSAWLGSFKDGSVIFCALGSEWKLTHGQFKELLLGLALTGLPFLVVLKIPIGFETMEDALPEGFKERVEGRGIVHSGWIQQQLILEHPSVGCFITHCGAGSLTEALVNKCQMVLLPQVDGDHIINARMMGGNLKVGVEVEKGEEDGWFTKESVSKAVKMVMDEENEVGREVRENHAKLKNFLVSHDLETICVDNFCQKLQDLLV
ncbi:unnamed protein product [Sphenostylis stenocarpa]|uniref:Glycosyltransferase n=1 Tax=Sphenostylis stenocarpa TaxID=92480 RepID=A0AA86SMN0_9FABA|nr:unnamed protein product [Sphenostylis stenocarpa]